MLAGSAFQLLCVLTLTITRVASEYVLDDTWPQWPSDASVSLITAVAVDERAPTGTEIHVAQRDTRSAPIFVFDVTGRLLRKWGNGSIVTAHGIRVQHSAADNSTYVWVTDEGDGGSGHTVKRFVAATGELLLTLGTAGQNGTGVDPFQFDNVADVAFDANGTVFVSDGDGGENNRVSAFAPPDYQLLWYFGHAGKSHYDFSSPHSIAVDQLQRVWVADRGNNRVVLYGQSADGPIWLATWTCFFPSVAWGVSVWRDRSWLIMADGRENALIVADIGSGPAPRRCNIMSRTAIVGPGQVHLLDVDQHTGDVYVAVIGDSPDTFARRYKYVPSDP